MIATCNDTNNRNNNYNNNNNNHSNNDSGNDNNDIVHNTHNVRVMVTIRQLSYTTSSFSMFAARSPAAPCSRAAATAIGRGDDTFGSSISHTITIHIIIITTPIHIIASLLFIISMVIIWKGGRCGWKSSSSIYIYI